MHECPQCGFEMQDDSMEKCPKCGFNFNYVLDCPYIVNGNCIHTKKPCYIEGLNYESCQTYLHKSGIIQ